MPPAVIVTRQVLQRTSPDAATVEVADAVTVTDRTGATVAACDGAGTLTVPVGGPYVVTGGGAAGGRAEHVLVGDLWVLAGQSNMQGVGRLDHGATVEAGPLVGLLDMARRWREPHEPLHVLSQSPDPCHAGDTDELVEFLLDWDVTQAHLGAGLGVPFAQAMVDATGVPVGLVATAHGGTSLDQWSPAEAGRAAPSLYWSMIRSIAAAGGQVAGILWYQGESDCTPEAAPSYGERFTVWVDAVRRDTGIPALPVHVVQLGRLVAEEGPHGDGWTWDTVRAAQLGWRSTGADGMAAAIDLPLDDGIHISTTGLVRLGRRLARVVAGAPSPEPVALELVDDRGPWVLLRCAGVSGGWRPVDRMRGFEVRGPDGAPRAVVFDARVDRDDPSVIRLGLGRAPDDGEVLWYGCGLDPACDVVDDADMALPAFGPVPLPTRTGAPVDVAVAGR